MKTVLFRGPVLTQSGYGVHARQIARWLLSRPGIDVKFATLPWGDTPWLLDSSMCSGLIGEVMKRSVPLDTKCNVSVQLQLPNEWDPSIATTNIGITAGVETDRCNPAWIQACNRMTTVVVPSNHARSSLQASGKLDNAVHVIPEAYSEALMTPAQLDIDLETSFNFLVFGQITGNNAENDRKNIFYSIRWLAEAFRGRDDVGIIVKTNSGRNSLIDRQLTTNMIRAAATESRGQASSPRLYLLHGDMSDEEVAGLYKHPKVKALVALTKGEGYGLPLLEAAVAGLPVIATNWSGHLDFLNKGKFISIYYQLGEVHPTRIDNQIFVKGARWAFPSGDDFKQRVTKFYEKPEVPTQWAQELSEKLVPLYSIENIKRTYDNVLGDLL